MSPRGEPPGTLFVISSFASREAQAAPPELPRHFAEATERASSSQQPRAENPEVRARFSQQP